MRLAFELTILESEYLIAVGQNVLALRGRRWRLSPSHLPERDGLAAYLVLSAAGFLDCAHLRELVTSACDAVDGPAEDRGYLPMTVRDAAESVEDGSLTFSQVLLEFGIRHDAREGYASMPSGLAGEEYETGDVIAPAAVEEAGAVAEKLSRRQVHGDMIDDSGLSPRGNPDYEPVQVCILDEAQRDEGGGREDHGGIHPSIFNCPGMMWMLSETLAA